MKLEFDSLDQLGEFAYFYALGVSSFRREQVAAATKSGSTDANAAPKSKTQRDTLQCAMKDTGLTEEQLTGNPDTGVGPPNSTDEAPAHLPDGEVTFDKVTIPDEQPEGENVQTDPPKRKRRTKAEIAAAEAAEKAALLVEGNVKPVEPAEADGVAEVAAIANQVATTAASIASDAEAKVQAARAVYTPELVETLRGHAELFDANRTEHLKEARDAISKKGFIPYNATMHGLGLGASIASYSDDEVKLHRAAIAHLLAS